MDQPGRHLLHLMAACLLAACGLTCSVAFESLAAALAGIVLAVVGLSAARPAFYSLPSRYLTGVAAAGGMALINATGSLGGYVGPWIVGLLRDRTGSFVPGMEAMSAMLLVAAVLTGVLMKVTGES
jgi:ACS family tartrate transporter-like MFS transporter